MEKKKQIYYALGGFILGVLTVSLIWFCVSSQKSSDLPSDSDSNQFIDSSENLAANNSNNDSNNNDLAENPSDIPDIAPTKAPDNNNNDNSDSNNDNSNNNSNNDNLAENPSDIPDITQTKAPDNNNPDNNNNNPSNDSNNDLTENPSDIPDITPTKAPENNNNNNPDNNNNNPNNDSNNNNDSSNNNTNSDNTSNKDNNSDTENSSAIPEHSANVWDKSAVYLGGDIVSYNSRQYRAKWWTQGEKPDSSDVWEDLGILDGSPAKPEGVDNAPIDASVPQNTELTDFKVVGYYPSWKPNKLSSVDFSIVTHVCYAFAIPTSDGGLRDLENPETAKTLIESAHANGAKVLLSIGGWSYNDTPLENVFMEATSDKAKTERFAKNILSMCKKYGFDGIDMDWEHPRVDGTSAKQYETLMLILSEKLHADNKLLTAAVLSGATADGNIYYDAAAHTNAVLNAVDFINIMAYDGGDGDRHSPYEFAVNCGIYWKETRGLPAYKVVLGVPFYARPSWADYGTIIESVPDAYNKDHTAYNGMDVYYNGVDTIAKKTIYAKENLGGIMIWELTQDTSDTKKSLLQTIGENIP